MNILGERRQDHKNQPARDQLLARFGKGHYYGQEAPRPRPGSIKGHLTSSHRSMQYFLLNNCRLAVVIMLKIWKCGTTELDIFHDDKSKPQTADLQYACWFCWLLISGYYVCTYCFNDTTMYFVCRLVLAIGAESYAATLSGSESFRVICRVDPEISNVQSQKLGFPRLF